MNEIILPDGWKRPRGYSNGLLNTDKNILFTSGQFGWDENEILVSTDYVAQVKQVLLNIAEIIKKSNLSVSDIVFLRWYITDADLFYNKSKEVASLFKEIIGFYPPMTAICVSKLLVEGALVQVEAIAIKSNS